MQFSFLTYYVQNHAGPLEYHSDKLYMSVLTDEEGRCETIPANSKESMEEEMSMSYETWNKALISHKWIREPILEKEELLRV